MKKTDLIKSIASRTYVGGVKVSQDVAREILDGITNDIAQGLKTDKAVQITGFGTFKANYKSERVGHNPKNVAEKITIPARVQVSFSGGENLKKVVNEDVK